MTLFKNLKEVGAEIHKLNNIIELLYWDQETKLPPNGVEERAEQIAYLSEILHKKLTDDGVGLLLDKLGVKDKKYFNEELNDIDLAFINNFARMYYREKKLSSRFVSDFARETSIGQNVWIRAKKENNFKLFEPNLKKIVEMLIEKSELIGYENHPYDALLDEYEPYMKSEKVREIFDELQKGLSVIVSKIKNSKRIYTDFLKQKFSIDKQDKFGRAIIKDLGYSMKKGRLDISAHPFTITMGAKDVRITTRYDENNLLSGLFSDIHETGHALYELGFSEKIARNILATGTSLGIHESQSRMWENLIGRSYEFWKYYFPKLKNLFKNELKNVETREFYHAVNEVKPSFIRVEADEVTYNLHIILRFNLEMDLISGKIKTEDLPEVWNEKMKLYFGIQPKKDTLGVLQDVHWSSGLIGYFPTYALGNIYSVQFYNRMSKDIPNISKEIGKGDFKNILNWLRENIHKHGSVYSADELCRRATGESLNPRYFLDYIDEKYRRIYEY